jgi:hypothetical protein
MNGTGVVGYIALLMIFGSILGGEGRANFINLRADSLSASNLLSMTDESLAIPISNQTQKKERRIRITIDGIPYEGTVYSKDWSIPVSTPR